MGSQQNECRECGDALVFSARQSGRRLCGPCRQDFGEGTILDIMIENIAHNYTAHTEVVSGGLKALGLTPEEIAQRFPMSHQSAQRWIDGEAAAHAALRPSVLRWLADLFLARAKQDHKREPQWSTEWPTKPGWYWCTDRLGILGLVEVMYERVYYRGAPLEFEGGYDGLSLAFLSIEPPNLAGARKALESES